MRAPFTDQPHGEARSAPPPHLAIQFQASSGRRYEEVPDLHGGIEDQAEFMSMTPEHRLVTRTQVTPDMALLGDAVHARVPPRSNAPRAASVARRSGILSREIPGTRGTSFSPPYEYSRAGPNLGASSASQADPALGTLRVDAMSFIVAPTADSISTASATVGIAVQVDGGGSIKAEAETFYEGMWSSGGGLVLFARGSISLHAVAVEEQQPARQVVAKCDVSLWDDDAPPGGQSSATSELAVSFGAEPAKKYLLLVTASVECDPGVIIATSGPTAPGVIPELLIGAASATLQARVMSFRVVRLE